MIIDSEEREELHELKEINSTQSSISSFKININSQWLFRLDIITKIPRHKSTLQLRAEVNTQHLPVSVQGSCLARLCDAGNFSIQHASVDPM